MSCRMNQCDERAKWSCYDCRSQALAGRRNIDPDIVLAAEL